jgi:hypothetical protein
MLNSNRKWSEIRSLRDLSNGQWGIVQSRLNKRELRDFEQLKGLLGCRQPTTDELLRIRSLKNKPQRASGAVDKRLPQLLEWLGLKDDLSKAFDGGVYLAPASAARLIPYVGVGGDDRISRWDGQSVDTFFTNGIFCLGCLEGIILWAAVVARGKPKFTNYRSVCEKCERGYRILAETFGSRIGHKIGREEFIRIVSSIAEHRRIEA